MITKLKTSFNEFGIYTDTLIKKDIKIFKYDDWIEDEQYGWEILSIDEIKSLSKIEKNLFLRYSYDIDFGKTIGTFNWKNAKHISNFMNHSCDPNIMYSDNDSIIAKRDIAAGEELTIDYGNFIVNFDQDFFCSCGSNTCRKQIQKNDWMDLIYEYGNNFPTFMHKKVTRLIQLHQLETINWHNYKSIIH